MEQLCKRIKLVVVDGPGVLTARRSTGDGVDDRHDAAALALLDADGIRVEVLGSTCPFQSDAASLEDALQSCGLDEIAYVLSDADPDDAAFMRAVAAAGGLVACPADAAASVRAQAGFVCLNKSGHGAMREFADHVLAQRAGEPLAAIKDAYPIAYEFLAGFNPATMANGHYELADGCSANVMSYTTRDLSSTFYEAHREYIDVQYIIWGSEGLMTCPTPQAKASVLTPYDAVDDAELYNWPYGGLRVMRAGDVAVLGPNDAHRGGIAVDGHTSLRKIVVKVPVER